TTSGVHSWMSSSAFFAESADCTVKPAASRARFSTRTICCSSSTTKILLPLSVIVFACRGGDGEADRGAAVSTPIFYPDLATMRFYNTLRDRQSHPQSSDRFLRTIGAEEPLKDLFAQSRWDPRPLVLYSKLDP